LPDDFPATGDFIQTVLRRNEGVAVGQPIGFAVGLQRFMPVRVFPGVTP
jgi:hypothetical protein